MQLPNTYNFRKWVTLVRRLQTPYYEEARLYFKRAKMDGLFDGANEIVLYSEQFLRSIINRYGED